MFHCRHWEGKVTEAIKAEQEKATQAEKQWQGRLAEVQGDWQAKLAEGQAQWAQDRAAAEQGWREAKGQAEQQWKQQLESIQHAHRWVCIGNEKKRKDYVFCRQFIEKPSVIPGCPVVCDAVSNLQRAGHGLRVHMQCCSC